MCSIVFSPTSGKIGSFSTISVPSTSNVSDFATQEGKSSLDLLPSGFLEDFEKIIPTKQVTGAKCMHCGQSGVVTQGSHSGAAFAEETKGCGRF